MKSLLVLTIMVCFTACGYDNGGNDPLSSVDGATDSLTNTEKLLTGTWSRPCQFNTNSNKGYVIETIAFAGTDANFQMVTKDYFYSDAGCQTEQLIRSDSRTLSNVDLAGSLISFT